MQYYPYQLSIGLCVLLSCTALPAKTVETDVQLKAETSIEQQKPQGALSFYEKRFLNDPIMMFDGDPLSAQLDQHIYQIREGSRGGYDAAGGACGCN